MFSRGRFFLIAAGVSLLSTTSIASAACTGVKCRCAVANGGTYDAATDRWSIHGCAPSQKIAFRECVAKASTRPQRSKSPNRPDRNPQNSCNSELAQRYFNEKQQCDNRRDMSNDVCKELRESAPQQSAGCNVQTQTVYAGCLQRLTTVYPVEVRRCPPP